MKIGHKIEKQYENPIDNFILDYICEPLSDKFHKWQMNPNSITIIGFLFSLISFWFLYNYKIHYFIMFHILAYVCDCLDGYIARKYNETSKFGDFFDHITDLIQNIIFLYLIINVYDFLKYKRLVYLTVGLLIGMFITQGCQEKIMKSENSSIILGCFKTMCFKPFSNNIKILRFLGAGTFQLYIIIISYYLWKQKVK
jgi:phosphatidylglycerophosphate synthase